MGRRANCVSTGKHHRQSGNAYCCNIVVSKGVGTGCAERHTDTHCSEYRCWYWVCRATDRNTQICGIIFYLCVFCVQLQSWKWVWPEQNEWNAQTAARGICQLSLRLHALKFLVQLCQAPNTTQLFEAPDTTQLSQAPDTTQLSQAPDTTQLSQAPDTKQLS